MLQTSPSPDVIRPAAEGRLRSPAPTWLEHDFKPSVPSPGVTAVCRFLPVEKLESCQSASFAGGLFMAGWGGAEVCGDRPVWAPLKAS